MTKSRIPVTIHLQYQNKPVDFEFMHHEDHIKSRSFKATLNKCGMTHGGRAWRYHAIYVDYDEETRGMFPNNFTLKLSFVRKADRDAWFIKVMRMKDPILTHCIRDDDLYLGINNEKIKTDGWYTRDNKITCTARTSYHLTCGYAEAHKKDFYVQDGEDGCCYYHTPGIRARLLSLWYALK
jgi:hypothetical protein